MKWPIRQHRLGAIGLTLALAFVAPVFAQRDPPQPNIRGRADIVHQLGVVQIDPAAINVAKLRPINFKPFEILDPKTGKKIAPKTELTLPNGKKMTAEAYYAELNKLEQGFNTIGHSLRGPQMKTDLMHSVLDKAVLERQARAIGTAHLKLGPRAAAVPSAAALEQERTAAQALKPAVARALAAMGPNIPKPKEAKDSRSWAYSVGSSSTFKAYLEGKLSLSGSVKGTSVSEEVRAGGYLFGKHAEILHQTGAFNAPQTGNVGLKVKIDVLGSTIYNLDESDPVAKFLSKSFSKSVDFSAKIYFTLGPIPMSAKLGAHGDAGVNLGAFVAHSYANGTIHPFVHTNVYGQVGVDIVVGGAGLSASMILLNDDLTLGGNVSLKTDSSGKLYFHEYLSGYNDLEMLKGKVGVYVYIYVPAFDIPPWDKKEWHWKLWDWDGFKSEGYLFKETKKTYLY